MDSKTDDRELYLIGFRIEPDIAEPSVYSIYVDDDGPLLSNGLALFFPRRELAAKALAMSDLASSEINAAPTELQIVYDITDAIYTLQERDEDISNGLLDFINLLLDYAACLGVQIPDTYRKQLEMLVDHVTFHVAFADFLRENHLERQRLVDALYWGIGMMLYNSRIIV